MHRMWESNHFQKVWKSQIEEHPREIPKRLDYEIDTSSDDNLMPINMFKTLFPIVKITEVSTKTKKLKCVHTVIPAY